MHNRRRAASTRTSWPRSSTTCGRAIERARRGRRRRDGSIIVDPGFGFGKTPGHNLALLARPARAARPRPADPARDVAQVDARARCSTCRPDQRLEATLATTALGHRRRRRHRPRARRARERPGGAHGDAIVRGTWHGGSDPHDRSDRARRHALPGHATACTSWEQRDAAAVRGRRRAAARPRSPPAVDDDLARPSTTARSSTTCRQSSSRRRSDLLEALAEAIAARACSPSSHGRRGRRPRPQARRPARRPARPRGRRDPPRRAGAARSGPRAGPPRSTQVRSSAGVPTG